MASTVRFISHFAEASRAISVATARAMNRAATSARAVGSREISRSMGLKVGTVRDQIRIARATPVDLTATLSVRGRRIPLIEFGARGPEPSRGRGRGVSYRLGGRSRGRVPSAFIATMRSGHRGVFKRLGRKRLPIVELLGPSIALVFSRRPIVAAMTAKFEETLEKNIGHEIEFEVRRT